MKYLLSLLLALSISPAKASPYFRVAEVNGPVFISGVALFDPNSGIEATQAASMLSVITHSTKDGCLLPSVVCEDWSPLSVGGAFTGTNKILAIGPQFNLEPWMKAGLLAVLNGITPATYATGIKAALAPSMDDTLRISIGTHWAVAPEQNWKGYFKISFGPELKF